MKKSTFFFTVLLLAFSAAAQQEPFVVEGKIGSLGAPATVYLIYPSVDGFRRDSVELAGGRFRFSGEVAHPTRATLLLSRDSSGESPRQDSQAVYLHRGTIKVIGEGSVSGAIISGSKLNADYQRLQATLKPIYEKDRTVTALYEGAPAEERSTEVFRKAVNAKRDLIRAEAKAIHLEFAGSNPQSLMALIVLQDYAGTDLEVVKSLFAALAPEVRNSTLGNAFAAKIEKLGRTAVGQRAPEFTQNDPEGNPVSLASYRGNYVLIDFWASGCVPCRAENPYIVKAYERFKAKNFTVLGVSLDDERRRDAWLKAVEDDKLTWTQVSDLKGWKNEAAALYNVRAIPQNFLVDPDGIIVASNLRGEALVETLEQLLD